MNRSELQPIEQRVKACLKQYFGSSTPFLVLGVSGGPDSMALMHIYRRLNLNISVVHINYEQRASQSDRDQQLVEETATSWNMKCVSVKVGDQLDDDSNFQDEARKVRFRYLEKMRRQENADAISFAHHQEDQVETILHKLFRGAGMESWTGMQVFDDHIFRPLLDTSKSQINSYVNSWDIPHRIDESNLESVYARNFLRNEWIPNMERWFPGWRKNILQLSETSNQYSQVLDALLRETEKEEQKILRSKVIAWNPAVRKAVILHWIKYYMPDITISKHALDELSKLEELQTGGYLKLNEDVKIYRDRTFFVLSKNVKKVIKEEHKVHEKSIAFSPKRFSEWYFTLIDFQNPDFNSSLYLDKDKMQWPLKLRSWRAGDRIQPLGMKGTQKIKDHLTNRKVSAVYKSEAMVLEDQQEHLVAVLFPVDTENQPGTIAEFVKCDPNTKKALRITPVTYGSF